MTSGEQDRRKYKRVQAPVMCRSAEVALRFMQQQKPQDISLGGLRIYAEEEVKKGTRFELELFLPDASSVTCKVEVVWIDKLPPGGLAPFDVGLMFIDIADADRARLAEVLE